MRKKKREKKSIDGNDHTYHFDGKFNVKNQSYMGAFKNFTPENTILYSWSCMSFMDGLSLGDNLWGQKTKMLLAGLLLVWTSERDCGWEMEIEVSSCKGSATFATVDYIWKRFFWVTSFSSVNSVLKTFVNRLF